MTDSNVHDYPVPVIGVSGLVFNDQGEVLLICRDNPPARGQWSLPGGRLEAGESLAEACRREVKEETNVDVSVQHVVAVVERNIENFHYVIIDFWAQLQPGKISYPQARSDASDARWVMPGDLSGYALVDGLEEIIRNAYLRRRNGGVGGLTDVRGTRTDFIIT